ncbi:MAG: NAD(P)/FAD-dependent oxidoreductase [Oscillospiraceae bacterium]|nr:NAD(P)/FAD-dependent oxidoreductase [Oscillospiraceae bacterium]
MYDAAIIGTGPAGVSAALTLKANEKNFIWIGSKTFSDKVGKAERIANYPGLPMVTGQEMNAAFRRQCEELDISIEDRMVTSIVKFGDHYALTAGSEFYETYTVIFATGVANVGTLPGEAELVGKGVSYCATCDGFLYKNKTIAVICTAKRFEHEVSFLAGIAARVYFFPLYKDPEPFGENVEIRKDRAVQMNAENGRLSSLTLNSGETVSVDGVFCLRESVSLGTLLPGLSTEQGHIAVDRGMATNLPGVFAAGDCTGRPYQYVKAAGEGNVAAHSAITYLAALKK